MDWTVIIDTTIKKCNPILFGELYKHKTHLIYYYQDDWSKNIEDKSCSDDVWAAYCCDVDTIDNLYPDMFNYENTLSDNTSITCILKLK